MASHSIRSRACSVRRLAAPVVLLAVALAGCGGDSSDDLQLALDDPSQVVESVTIYNLVTQGGPPIQGKLDEIVLVDEGDGTWYLHHPVAGCVSTAAHLSFEPPTEDGIVQVDFDVEGSGGCDDILEAVRLIVTLDEGFANSELRLKTG